MPSPQQPELRRSEHVPALAPDAAAAVLEARDQPEMRGDTGPIPPDQQSGTGSVPIQDKPDLDAFASRAATPADPSQPATEGAPSKLTGRVSTTVKRLLAMGVVAALVAVVISRRRGR